MLMKLQMHGVKLDEYMVTCQSLLYQNFTLTYKNLDIMHRQYLGV